jgi:hypothetical protein
MAPVGIHTSRVERLLASPRVMEKKPHRDVAWPIPYPEPADLSALYLACDGLELDDGTRLFGRGELRDVTDWLVLEKGLAWSDDLVIVGERRDIVIVLDLDVDGERAAGGALETGIDDLGVFERVASDVVGYLCSRAAVLDDVAPPPEIAARRAAASLDASGLERELARPMYPGHERLFASLALELGTLWARAGEKERAMSAFARSVEARVASVGRGGREAERASAWLAAAHASRAGGALPLALECEARSQIGPRS